MNFKHFLKLNLGLKFSTKLKAFEVDFYPSLPQRFNWMKIFNARIQNAPSFLYYYCPIVNFILGYIRKKTFYFDVLIERIKFSNFLSERILAIE